MRFLLMVWLSRRERIGSCGQGGAGAATIKASASWPRARLPGPKSPPRAAAKKKALKAVKAASSGDGAAELRALVGLVTESREAHLKRHGGFLRRCPRCRFYKFGGSWIASYGSLSHPLQPRTKTVWLQERPARWGGTWALGCYICADFVLRKQTAEKPDGPPSASTPARGKHKRFCSAWTKYEAVSWNLQSEQVRQHKDTDAHKIGADNFVRPDAPVHIMLQATFEDDKLLAGAVPQPADWLRAWRLTQDPSSWESAAHAAETEHFIASIRSRPVQRKAYRAMVICMAEVIRHKKRELLREASAIFLSFDDKNGRKLLRCKVDMPAASPAARCLDALGASGCGTFFEYGASILIIGCARAGQELEVRDYERDYAERTASEVLAMIRRLCTPLGEVTDEVLYKGILRKVRGIVVDGALLKTAQVLQTGDMPRIVIILRDPAHVIRTTCKDPLHDGAAFREQHDRLFASKHAVLKDLQNSHLWKDQLQAAQKELLREGGALGGLGRPLLHLNFVQPRFESFAAPRRRYVCLLRAIAHVLVIKAGDSRQSAELRRRCQASFDAMTSVDCFVAGLAGDFGEVCVEFLRLFDVQDHDPARTASEVRHFKEKLKALFQDGYVVCDASCLDAENKTLAQIALENIQEPFVARLGAAPPIPRRDTDAAPPVQYALFFSLPSCRGCCAFFLLFFFSSLLRRRCSPKAVVGAAPSAGMVTAPGPCGQSRRAGEI